MQLLTVIEVTSNDDSAEATMLSQSALKSFFQPFYHRLIHKALMLLFSLPAMMRERQNAAAK